jgi:hypothetical protein
MQVRYQLRHTPSVSPTRLRVGNKENTSELPGVYAIRAPSTPVVCRRTPSLLKMLST